MFWNWKPPQLAFLFLWWWCRLCIFAFLFLFLWLDLRDCACRSLFGLQIFLGVLSSAVRHCNCWAWAWTGTWKRFRIRVRIWARRILANFLMRHLAKLCFVRRSWLIFTFCLGKLKKLQFQFGGFFIMQVYLCLQEFVFSLQTSWSLLPLTQNFQSQACPALFLYYVVFVMTVWCGEVPRFFLQLLHLRWCGRSDRL